MLVIMMLGVCSNSFAADNGTDAIIKKYDINVDVSSSDSYVHKVHRELVIINRRAEDLANVVFQVSKNVTLTDFSIVITDAQGSVIRKIKRSDLRKTEYSTELAHDDSHLYSDISLPSFPVTVTTDYTISHNGNVLSYPIFFPQSDYGIMVMEANYTITMPNGVECQYENINGAPDAQKTIDSKGRNQLTFKVADLAPIEKISFSRPLNQRVPMVFISPKDFKYHGSKGSMRTWKDLGLWCYGLLSDRQTLPQEAIDKVRGLVAGCHTDYERVKALYKFLGETTRYVSIQLGLGGYQPMTAQKVWETGFGDCKALTNYMMSLLAVCGIKSYYSLVSTRDKELLRNMANFQQLNHVILQVPLPEDTIWIECTNPSLPLGFLHDGIEGHEAVCITEEGGIITKIPDYNDSDNIHKTEVEIWLTGNGTADVNIHDCFSNGMYNAVKSLPHKTQNEQTEILGRIYNITSSPTGMGKLTVTQSESRLPALEINYSVKGKVGNVMGSREFLKTSISANIINEMTVNTENRQDDIFVEQGYASDEHVIIHLPENIVVESMPEDINIETPFGYIESKISVKDTSLDIHTYYLVRHGCFSSDTSVQFNSFQKSIANLYNRKIVLKNK